MSAAPIEFDDRGLIPCVMQDWSTGEVLTLAYMNAEALRRTRETGEMHFFSRSRQAPWMKGETSGNRLAVAAALRAEAAKQPRPEKPGGRKKGVPSWSG